MKVLFLDVDGVIAINGPLKKIEIRDGLTIPYSWDQEACDRLTTIIEQTNCEVVISSDWRKSYTLPGMREIFKYFKIPPVIIGYTPHKKEYKYGSLGYGRSLEINEWLAVHGVKNWCALDDLALSAIDGNRFVRTKNDIGLFDENIAERVIKILNDDNKEKS